MYDQSKQPDKMRERYAALPPSITELFEYGTVDVVIENIVKEFGLNEEQKDSLRMEIELVLYLFFPRTGLTERIKESLEVDKLKAEQISASVEENLFSIVDNELAFAEEELSRQTSTNTISTTPEVPTKDNPPATTPMEQNATSFIQKPAEKQPTETKPVNSEDSSANTPDRNLVKPIRTFADDVEFSRAHSYGAFRSREEQDQDDEPIHRSNQDDIMKR